MTQSNGSRRPMAPALRQAAVRLQAFGSGARTYARLVATLVAGQIWIAPLPRRHRTVGTGESRAARR
jgi:hypothetical protein